jgi:SAM-dependent methyltransferase
VIVAGAAAAVGAGVAVGVARSRSATGAGLREAIEFASVGVPRGPLGWVSARMMAIGHRPFYAVVAGVVDLRPDDDLLDVACGSGGYLRRQAAHVRSVAGLDASDIQLGLARRRLAERIHAGTAEIVEGDAMALPWEDGRFDAVTCIAGIDFFPDPQKAVREMYRVLRPGGRAVLTMGTGTGALYGRREAPGTDDASTSGETDPWGHRLWSEDYARWMIEDAGFTNISISHPKWGGTSRLFNAFSRLGGAPDARLVRAEKHP